MFKLINFFEMHDLNQLRHEMGAPMAKNFKTTIQNTFLDEDVIERLGTEGIEVLNFKEIEPQKDKTLGYKGQRVLVYIRDRHQHKDGELPRFHISYCKTLEQMRNNGRWQKYVVANREDGYFGVSINNGDMEFFKLNVCQNCLENLNWHDFSIRKMKSRPKKSIIAKFSIAEFFTVYPKSLFSIKPTYTYDTAPINKYSGDWSKISKNLKKEKGYRCEMLSCRIKLMGSDVGFLHVHHINGLRNDNSTKNLKVLCIRCHANEPNHAHMKSDTDYKKFMSKFKF